MYVLNTHSLDYSSPQTQQCQAVSTQPDEQQEQEITELHKEHQLMWSKGGVGDLVGVVLSVFGSA